MASRVPPEVRAAALADLHAGEQPAVVADRYRLDRNTVKQWKRRYVPAVVPGSVTGGVPETTEHKPIRQPAVEAQQFAIGELVLDLLRAKLEASRAIARAAQQPEWLAQQTAADLAQLGSYFDSTALAFGDRLAGAAPRDADDAPDPAVS